MTETPIHEVLEDLSKWTANFLSDSRARRYLLDKIEPVYSDPFIMSGLLEGSPDWSAAQEIAAIGLYAAELEGNIVAQKTFLEAVRVLAPLTSNQREWALAKLRTFSETAAI